MGVTVERSKHFCGFILPLELHRNWRCSNESVVVRYMIQSTTTAALTTTATFPYMYFHPAQFLTTSNPGYTHRHLLNIPTAWLNQSNPTENVAGMYGTSGIPSITLTVKFHHQVNNWPPVTSHDTISNTNASPQYTQTGIGAGTALVSAMLAFPQSNKCGADVVPQDGILDNVQTLPPSVVQKIWLAKPTPKPFLASEKWHRSTWVKFPDGNCNNYKWRTIVRTTVRMMKSPPENKLCHGWAWCLPSSTI